MVCLQINYVFEFYYWCLTELAKAQRSCDIKVHLIKRFHGYLGRSVKKRNIKFVFWTLYDPQWLMKSFRFNDYLFRELIYLFPSCHWWKKLNFYRDIDEWYNIKLSVKYIKEINIKNRKCYCSLRNSCNPTHMDEFIAELIERKKTFQLMGTINVMGLHILMES